MEKRQAVEFLEYLRQDRNLEGTIYRDALNMAIEALKAQLSKEGTTSDLISRQAVINAIENTNAKMSMPEWDEITNAVMSLPTIQPEPQEGHWIEGGIYRDVIECNCSECGQLMTTAATVRMNFCPNCGAKMKGVQNG